MREKFVPKPPVDAKDYEARLWEEVEQLAEHKSQLKQRQAELFSEIEERKRGANLHDMEEIRKMEAEYWRVDKMIVRYVDREEDLQNVLLHLSRGVVDQAELHRLLLGKPGSGEEKEMQKKGGRVVNKVGQAFSWIDYSGPPPTTHLTTGRHATAVRGNFKSEEADAEFFYRTTDTHGGKIRKSGNRGGAGSSWARQHIIKGPGTKGKK